jgi:hypothetical protein
MLEEASQGRQAAAYDEQVGFDNAVLWLARRLLRRWREENNEILTSTHTPQL